VGVNVALSVDELLQDIRSQINVVVPH